MEIQGGYFFNSGKAIKVTDSVSSCAKWDPKKKRKTRQ